MKSKLLYTTTTYLLPDTRQVRVDRNSHFEIHPLQDTGYTRTYLSDHSERLQYFEIIWFKTGKGQLIIDTLQHSIAPDTIFCLTPGQIRSCKLRGTVEGYHITFSQDFLYRWATYTIGSTWLDTNICGSSILTINADAEMRSDIGDLVEKMEKEYSHHYLLRSEILAGLLNILVIYISRRLRLKVNDFAQSKEIELVQKFISLVKVHFRTKKFVSDYASALFVTANHLNRIVKKITGTPASFHIQQHIIMEAKRQALHSNVSMKEVAYLLGFEDHSHFSKYFKNNSGMNFSSFKKGLATDLITAIHD